MKFFRPLPDVVVDTVRARGMPNQECVVLRTLAVVDTSNLALMVGYRDAADGVQCLPNHVFWFGDALLMQGSVLNIYTGTGHANSHAIGNGTFAYNLFWGLDKTVFNAPAFIPLVVRLENVTVGEAQSLPAIRALPHISSTS